MLKRRESGSERKKEEPTMDDYEAIAAENLLATINKRQLVELRRKMREARKSKDVSKN